MKKTVTSTIKDRIIKKGDILRISSKLYKEYLSAVSGHKRIVFKLFCEDDRRSVYEIENEDLITEEETLDTKKIGLLSMRFIDYRNDKNIDINLSRDKWQDSEIRVSGNDRNWVDAIFAELTEIINSIEPQRNIYINNYKLVIFTLGLWVNVIIFWLFKIALNKQIDDYFPFLIKDVWLISLILMWCGFTLGYYLAYKIRLLWPNIEFKFGPEHFLKESRIRKIIATILVLFVLPILIQILFSVIYPS